MNNESPLIPKGSLLEQQNKGRIRFKIAVFAVLGLHGVAFLALLMAGCNRNTDTPTTTPTTATTPDVRPESSTPVVTPAATIAESNTTPVATAPTNPGPGITTVPTSPVTGATTVATGPVVTPSTAITTPVAPATTDLGTPLPGAATEYKIVKNDTLAKIAKHAHITLAALTNANPGVESTKLKIGQTIHVPAAVAPTPAAGGATTTPGAGGPAAPVPEAGAEQVYVVKSGDSLIKIAGQFGIRVKALRAANTLKTDKIHVGDKLKIPAKTAATAAPATAGTAGAATAPAPGAGGATTPMAPAGR